MRTRGPLPLLATMLVVGFAGCSLTTDLAGLATGGGDGGASSTSSSGGGPNDGGGGIDAGGDAAKGEVLASGGVVVATDVSDYAAGSAQQHHVHFAKNLGAWVVFYLPKGRKDVIATRLTPDWVSFVDGPSLTLPRPHDGDGRNFDVAYVDTGGADVFHLVFSMKDGDLRYSYRARGRGAAGTIVFDAPSELGHTGQKFSSLDPDGPSVAILASRRVLIASGFNEVEGHTGNFCAFLSTKPDEGAADWDHAFAPGDELQTAQSSVNARSVIATPDGALGMWEKGESDPRPTAIQFATYNGTDWSGVNDVGFASTAFDVADWGQARTDDGRVHALRYVNGTFEHRYFDPSGHQGFAIQPEAHAEGDGLLLFASGKAVLAFGLEQSGRAIRRARLEADTWTAWENVAAGDSSRRHLSGNSGVVLWERQRTGATDLAALPLP